MKMIRSDARQNLKESNTYLYSYSNAVKEVTDSIQMSLTQVLAIVFVQNRSGGVKACQLGSVISLTDT